MSKKIDNFKKLIMNYKLIVSILMLLVSCKQDHLKEESANSSVNNIKATLLIGDFNLVNKDFTEIVKQNNEFKLSCAKPENFNHVKLTDKMLHLEIVEPIDYEISKTEKIDKGYKISFKNEEFYYKVAIVDEKLGITYWQNIANGKTDEDFSFYAIESSKLKSANLKKEIGNSDEVDSVDNSAKVINSNTQNWNGDYDFKTKVESLQSDELIDMEYFINIDKNKAILSIGTKNPTEAYCEGDYSVKQNKDFIHLIHTGETGICTGNIEDTSFDIKKEGDQFYIRSKRFVNFEWQKIEKIS